MYWDCSIRLLVKSFKVKFVMKVLIHGRHTFSCKRFFSWSITQIVEIFVKRATNIIPYTPGIHIHCVLLNFSPQSVQQKVTIDKKFEKTHKISIGLQFFMILVK